MKNIGIICEYNPFHNGHLFQLNCAREMGATHITAVMSGNFVQRGDAAVCSKFARAKAAVSCGADLVIELPVPFAAASAENFARGGISLFDGLGCVDGISFGCECDDIALLKKAAEFSEKFAHSDEAVALMNDGKSFPAALSALCPNELKPVLDSPNNILAVEYLKQVVRLNCGFTAIPVKREGAAHDEKGAYGGFASASEIRSMLKENKDVSAFVPPQCLRMLSENDLVLSEKVLETLILYRFRTMSREDIALLPEVSDELAGRLFNAARTEKSLSELMFAAKTRRYPLARIRRALICGLLGLQKADISERPPYVHILAFNRKGAEILAKAKETAKNPVSTSLSDLKAYNESCRRFAEIEARAGDIYALLYGSPHVCGEDFTAKTEIITE